MSRSPTKRKVYDHPPFEEMINNAISHLKERSGSSVYAITKFIVENFTVHHDSLKHNLKRSLRAGVDANRLVKIKASYRIVKQEKSVPAPKSRSSSKSRSTSKSRSKSPTKSRSRSRSRSPSKEKVKSSPSKAVKKKATTKKKGKKLTLKKKGKGKKKVVFQKTASGRTSRPPSRSLT